MAKNGNGNKIYIEDLIPLIYEFDGVISDIAAHLKITRHTVYARIAESVEAQAALDDARETFKDRIEKRLRERMLENDTVLIFLAKTLCKDRGYVERQQVEHSGSLDVSKLSDDELRAIAEGKSGG